MHTYTYTHVHIITVCVSLLPMPVGKTTEWSAYWVGNAFYQYYLNLRKICTSYCKADVTDVAINLHLRK